MQKPDSNKSEYSLDVKTVLEKLKTNEKVGLSEFEAEKRLKEYGTNTLEEESKLSWFKSLIRQCKSFILYILLVAAVISFIKDQMIEVYVIFFIIIFIVMLGFFMEFKASKDMEALKKLSPQNAKVLREGKEKIISKDFIIPGDIIVLNRGDIVPADSRIVSCAHLHVDESMLTGESVEVIKSHEANHTKEVPIAEQKNMLFSGTHITNGHAIAVVLRTGKETEMGKISVMLSNVKEQDSPLQKRIDKLSKQITFVVIGICLVVFLLVLIRGTTWDNALLLILAMAVGGVPEALPAVIGIALALGIKNMISKNAIVKQMSSVETLGTCTVICTDKTGTLTQNNMVVENILLYDKEIKVTGNGLIPEGQFIFDKKPITVKRNKDLSKLLEISYLCNNSKLFQEEGTWKINGESTEGSLMVLAKKANIDEKKLSKIERLHELTFDPVRKCMSTIDIRNKKKEVNIKGAPEIIIGKSKYYLKNGKPVKMSQKVRDHLLEKNHEYACLGLRVLGLGYKSYNKNSFKSHDVEKEIVFVGLVAIRDPPAEGVKEAIQTAQTAGIKVIMITGDNPITAKAIGRELGICDEESRVITGQELDNMTDTDLLMIINEATIFARTTPSHKLRIVNSLQKKNQIVAMTGDGVNDSPALKQADIGVAMGGRGTEVAKEASNMVLRDDNFKTIVEAVREGRIIYSNIRKFIYYMLAINLAELSLIAIAALFGLPLPLTPLMILFINIITSDILAIAVVKESGSPWIMEQKPRHPDEGIVNEYLLLRISQSFPIIAMGTFSLFMWELWLSNNLLKAQSIAFASLILFEVFHAFNSRSFVRSNFTREIRKNPIFTIALILTAISTLLCLYWAPMQAILNTVPLSLSDWGRIFLISPIILLFVEFQKLVVKSEFKERKRLSNIDF